MAWLGIGWQKGYSKVQLSPLKAVLKIRQNKSAGELYIELLTCNEDEKHKQHILHHHHYPSRLPITQPTMVLYFLIIQIKGMVQALSYSVEPDISIFFALIAQPFWAQLEIGRPLLMNFIYCTWIKVIAFRSRPDIDSETHSVVCIRLKM